MSKTAQYKTKDRYQTKPEKIIDESFLMKLSKLHLSDKVISELVGVSEDTLHRRYADKMGVWRSESKAKIAEVLYDEAINQREPWAIKLYAQRFLDFDPCSVKIEISAGLNKKSIPVDISNSEKLEMLERYKSILLKGQPD